MNTILYLDNHYVESLHDLKQIIEKAELGSLLYREVRTAFCNDLLTAWLAEGSETLMANSLASLHKQLPDDELLGQLKKIFSGRDVEIEKPPFTKFASLKSIRCHANDQEVKLCYTTLVIGDFKGDAELDMEFEIHEAANFIYNIGLLVDETEENRIYTDTRRISMRTKEKSVRINFKFPTIDIVKSARVKVEIECDKEPIIISLTRIPEDILWFDKATCALRYNDLEYRLIKVQGGPFQMGASDQDLQASSTEKPRHTVTLDSFFIGETQVTQSLWRAVAVTWCEWLKQKGLNILVLRLLSELGDSDDSDSEYTILDTSPSRFSGANRPVESVSWDDCKEFVKILNQLTGQNFSLPTEAEWEYAARGGRQSANYKFSGSNNASDVAWYDDNETHPVKQKRPNELGLFDMSGNVFEWCEDWFDISYYSVSPTSNPKGPADGLGRVCRGGYFGYWSDRLCRSINREHYSPDSKLDSIGLRLVLRPSE